MACSKFIPLVFDIYNMCNGNKHEHLAVDILEFDKSKVSLIRSEIDPHNFKVLYDAQKFRLKIEVLKVS